MPYVRKYETIITLSTLGAATAYTTDFNGAVSDVYIKMPLAVGANCKVTVTSETTTIPILTVTNPSTLGAWYRPRTVVHGTTANALPSTTLSDYVYLTDERTRVLIASSSGLSGKAVTFNMRVI